MILGKEGLCILELEPPWCADITVIVSLLLGVAAALGEELAWSIVVEVGSKGNTVWYARYGASCTQGALFLGCTHLCVKANSL